MDEQTTNTGAPTMAPASAPASGAPVTVSNNTLMGILAYLGILAIIPFLMAKDEPFVKFHLKQGLVLLSIELAIWVVGMFMWQLWMILQIVNLGVLVLAIMGIINVVQGKQAELPLVGSFSSYFNI
jgi:uncharacterized membrane protein